MNAHQVYLGRPAREWAAQLKSDDPLERRLAVYALGEIGPAARQAEEQFAAVLDDPVNFVRVWAAAALAKVSPTDERSVAVLLEALGDRQGFVRSLAAWHLGRIGGSLPSEAGCVAHVRPLLEDRDPSVRTEAELALRRLQRS
jgi:HEAT repeat protein